MGPKIPSTFFATNKAGKFESATKLHCIPTFFAHIQPIVSAFGIAICVKVCGDGLMSIRGDKCSYDKS